MSKGDIYRFVTTRYPVPLLPSVHRSLDTQCKRKRILVGADGRISCPPLYLDRRQLRGRCTQRHLPESAWNPCMREFGCRLVISTYVHRYIDFVRQVFHPWRLIPGQRLRLSFAVNVCIVLQSRPFFSCRNIALQVLLCLVNRQKQGSPKALGRESLYKYAIKAAKKINCQTSAPAT